MALRRKTTISRALAAAMTAALVASAGQAGAVTLLLPDDDTFLFSGDEDVLLDPTGSGCLDYRPDDFETPFSSKLEPEPFCIPEPCTEMMSRGDLRDRIMGRAPVDWEWDTYVSRYSEGCISETRAPWPDDDRDFVFLSGAFDDTVRSSRDSFLGAFGIPSNALIDLPPSVVSAVTASDGLTRNSFRTAGGGGSSAFGGDERFGGGGGGGGGGGSSSTSSFDDGDGAGGTGGDASGPGLTTPSPVPLPLGLALLMGALGILTTFRMRRA